MKRHDLIQPDEQSSMQVAYRELGWSLAKIASVFNRDPRAVAKKVKEVRQTKVVTSGEEDKPPLATNVSTATQEKPVVCSTPPDDVDVATLKSWGVPAKKAPDILYQWRELHRRGCHHMCQAFRTLEEDLTKRSTPFTPAYLLLQAELQARETGVDIILRDIDLSRKYRSWENRPQYDTFIKEIQALDKPLLDAREKHLTELAIRLIKWRAEIEEASPEDKYKVVLTIREDSLFESMMTHCFGVAQTYEKLRFLTLEQEEKSQLINRLLKEIDRTLLKKTYATKWCLYCVR